MGCNLTGGGTRCTTHAGITGRFFITPHAVRRYAEHVGNQNLTYHQILGRLIRLVDEAHFVRHLPTGADLWRTRKPERLRLIGVSGDGPLPVVATVMARSDHDAR